MDHRSLDRRTLVKVAGIAGAGAAASVAALATGAASIAAQSTPGASPSAAPSGTLVIGKNQEAVGFDPAVVTASSSGVILAVTCEQLVTFDESGTAQPMLAESWESPDELTYVFTLRKGVTFHNGQPLTAADVKYSFDRIIDPATKSPWASQFAPVESVEATDDQTVTIKLKTPYGPFLATLSAGFAAILPQADPPIDFQSMAVGTGAFAWGTYTKDVETILNAHDGYWQAGLPKLETVNFTILPDESARLAAVRTDQVQVTTLTDPVSVESAKSSEGVVTVSQETTDYYLLGLNCAKAPFDNEKVRQALSLAIDRQAIIDAVFFGNGHVSGPIVPTLGAWATPVDQLPNYAVDPDQAKALLAEAGVENLSFKILVGDLTTDFQNVALVIQDQLKQIGVDAQLDQVEWGDFISRWKEHDFESFVSFNGSGNDPDRALFPTLRSDGSTNVFGYNDPNVDKLLDEGRATSDPEARKKIYGEIEQAVATAAPIIFINTRVAQFAMRDTVSGFAPTAMHTWDLLKETTVSS